MADDRERRLVYELFLRYTGKHDWNKPFIIVQKFNVHPEAYKMHVKNLERFKPYKLTSLTLNDGKINPSIQAHFDLKDEFNLEERKVSAFLDIETITGPWRVFQPIHLKDFTPRNKDEILLAYAQDDGIELYGNNTRKISNGVITFDEVYPAGKLVSVNLRAGLEAGIRQKLFEKLPLIKKDLSHRAENANINSVFHVGNPIESTSGYKSLPALIGSYS